MSACEFCQKNKTSNQKSAGLLQLLTIPVFRCSSVSVGFITQLPETAAGHQSGVCGQVQQDGASGSLLEHIGCSGVLSDLYQRHLCQAWFAAGDCQ